MILKICYHPKSCILSYVFFLILFFAVIKTNAQCAGTDNQLTVCNITDSTSKSIDLYSLLGSFTSGGVWTDDFFSGGLNVSTGILNAQLITKSGIYTYTYTVDNNSGCKSSAKITVTIGGYAGISSPNVSACSDDLTFNLFQGFNGNFLSPQSNGVWSDDDNTGALVGNTVDATRVGLGTHSFSYTMPAIGTCPSQSSTVNVTVFRAPNPGIGNVVILCDSDYESFETKLNLNDVLTGEDPNGRWLEVSGTTELTNTYDSTIDLKHTYNTSGAGVYNFIYSVSPSNPICAIKKSTVSFVIEKQLDFTGAVMTVNADICENQINTANYNVTLKEGTKKIPQGSYYVTYIISGVVEPITVISNFNNGQLNFGINRINFPSVGSYTVSIIDVVKVGTLGACKSVIGTITDVLNVFPLPKIDQATLTIDPTCLGMDALVKISGDNNLTEGNYSIIYNLSESNTTVAQQAFFKVAVGTGSFVIPSNMIPVAGAVKFQITNITNLSTGCTTATILTKEFTVKPLPVVPNLQINVADGCINQPTTVNLSGLGTIKNATVKYSLTGANNANNQSAIVTVTSGNATFTLPSTEMLNSGTTTISITTIADNTIECATPINNVTKSFKINVVANAPVTKSEAFCINDKKTIANLTPSGSQYNWYNSPTSTVILNPNTLLVTGTYYVQQASTATSCESARAASIVTINEIAAPTLDQNGENFCGLDKPTINNLSTNTNSNGTILWFDAATNGKILNANDLLVNGFTYYGINYSSATNCYSNPLVVTVSLSNCEVTPKFFIPDGFSPNGDGINDTYSIPDIEYIYPEYTLEIYNRYGNLIFNGNKDKAEWDGKNSDSKNSIDGVAPNGVYFYIINFNKGNTAPKQGRLYLSR